MSICGLRLYFTDRSGGVGNRALGAVRSLCRREQTLSYLGNQLTAAAGPPLLIQGKIQLLIWHLGTPLNTFICDTALLL